VLPSAYHPTQRRTQGPSVVRGPYLVKDINRFQAKLCTGDGTTFDRGLDQIVRYSVPKRHKDYQRSLWN
jgi:hypothetical protein